MANSEKTPPPLISVGLPTYNRPDYAKSAIQSCLRQDYANYELIISDDSPDASLGNYVHGLHSDKIRYYHNRPSLGMPKKLDDLAEKARARWMVILGDDDTFEPGYLSAVARVLEHEPDVEFVRTRYRLLDAKGQPIKVDIVEKPVLSPAELFASLFRPWFEIVVNITGAAFRVDRLKQTGGFPNFHQGFYIDRDAWARLGSFGKTRFLDEPLVNIRLFDPTALSKKFEMNYDAFLGAKSQVAQAVEELRQRLLSENLSDPDKAQMTLGQKRFQAFLREDSHFYINRRMIASLKDKQANARKDCLAMIEWCQKLALSCPLSFRYFSFLANLPYWPRVVLLSIYRKINHLWIKLFPPKTFSRK